MFTLYLNIYSSLIYNCWKLEMIPKPINQWVNKLCYILIMEPCSALRRNILVHAKTWMNLKQHSVTERSQRLRCTYCKIPFIWNSWKGKTKRQKTDWWLPEPGSGGSGPTAEEHAGTFWSDGCILCLDGEMTTWLYKLVKIHRTVYLKRVNFFSM